MFAESFYMRLYSRPKYSENPVGSANDPSMYSILLMISLVPSRTYNILLYLQTSAVRNTFRWYYQNYLRDKLHYVPTKLKFFYSMIQSLSKSVTHGVIKPLKICLNIWNLVVWFSLRWKISFISQYFRLYNMKIIQW